MARSRLSFVCRSCGSTQSRWLGKCPDCGTWDSLEEHRADASAARDPQRGLAETWAGAPDSREAPRAVPIGSVSPDAEDADRLPTGIGELDRVLGGTPGPDGRLQDRGLVPGSVVLVGGEPGIGKSTLMLQAAGAWAMRDLRVLYVSSEESGQQVRLRAERLGIGSPEQLFVLADTNLARIVEQVRSAEPRILVIDSIQMIYKSDLDASPGSVTQLRRCASELAYLAKASGTAVVLVGHVTKDGQIAGPRLLEHLVDAVLYFEGDRFHAGRLVRAIKNRFGTTLELGIFEMTGAGLHETPAGASVAAIEHAEDRPGAVVCPVMHGSRCMLVEIQALTATGFPGSAKRKSSGLDANRLAMLIAVLEQHAGLRLSDRDVFASSVGGIRVGEPGSDLALLLAIAGAHHRRALGAGTVAIGEIGLGGEVRPVSHLEQRLREAARLGYRAALVPAQQADSIRAIPGISPEPVERVGDAIDLMGATVRAPSRAAPQPL